MSDLDALEASIDALLASKAGSRSGKKRAKKADDSGTNATGGLNDSFSSASSSVARHSAAESHSNALSDPSQGSAPADLSSHTSVPRLGHNRPDVIGPSAGAQPTSSGTASTSSVPSAAGLPDRPASDTEGAASMAKTLPGATAAGGDRTKLPVVPSKDDDDVELEIDLLPLDASLDASARTSRNDDMASGHGHGRSQGSAPAGRLVAMASPATTRQGSDPRLVEVNSGMWTAGSAVGAHGNDVSDALEALRAAVTDATTPRSHGRGSAPSPSKGTASNDGRPTVRSPQQSPRTPKQDVGFAVGAGAGSAPRSRNGGRHTPSGQRSPTTVPAAQQRSSNVVDSGEPMAPPLASYRPLQGSPPPTSVLESTRRNSRRGSGEWASTEASAGQGRQQKGGPSAPQEQQQWSTSAEWAGFGAVSAPGRANTAPTAASRTPGQEAQATRAAQPGTARTAHSTGPVPVAFGSGVPPSPTPVRSTSVPRATSASRLPRVATLGTASSKSRGHSRQARNGDNISDTADGAAAGLFGVSQSPATISAPKRSSSAVRPLSGHLLSHTVASAAKDSRESTGKTPHGVSRPLSEHVVAPTAAWRMRLEETEKEMERYTSPRAVRQPVLLRISPTSGMAAQRPQDDVQQAGKARGEREASMTLSHGPSAVTVPDTLSFDASSSIAVGYVSPTGMVTTADAPFVLRSPTTSANSFRLSNTRSSGGGLSSFNTANGDGDNDDDEGIVAGDGADMATTPMAVAAAAPAAPGIRTAQGTVAQRLPVVQVRPAAAARQPSSASVAAARPGRSSSVPAKARPPTVPQYVNPLLAVAQSGTTLSKLLAGYKSSNGSKGSNGYKSGSVSSINSMSASNAASRSPSPPTGPRATGTGEHSYPPAVLPTPSLSSTTPVEIGDGSRLLVPTQASKQRTVDAKAARAGPAGGSASGNTAGLRSPAAARPAWGSLAARRPSTAGAAAPSGRARSASVSGTGAALTRSMPGQTRRAAARTNRDLADSAALGLPAYTRQPLTAPKAQPDPSEVAKRFSDLPEARYVPGQVDGNGHARQWVDITDRSTLARLPEAKREETATRLHVASVLEMATEEAVAAASASTRGRPGAPAPSASARRASTSRPVRARSASVTSVDRHSVVSRGSAMRHAVPSAATGKTLHLGGPAHPLRRSSRVAAIEDELEIERAKAEGLMIGSRARLAKLGLLPARGETGQYGDGEVDGEGNGQDAATIDLTARAAQRLYEEARYDRPARKAALAASLPADCTFRPEITSLASQLAKDSPVPSYVPVEALALEASRRMANLDLGTTAATAVGLTDSYDENGNPVSPTANARSPGGGTGASTAPTVDRFVALHAHAAVQSYRKAIVAEAQFVSNPDLRFTPSIDEHSRQLSEASIRRHASEARRLEGVISPRSTASLATPSNTSERLYAYSGLIEAKRVAAVMDTEKQREAMRKPRLNARSLEMANRIRPRSASVGGGRYSSLTEMPISHRPDLLQKRKDIIDLAGCTFKPVINARSVTLAAKVYNGRPEVLQGSGANTGGLARDAGTGAGRPAQGVRKRSGSLQPASSVRRPSVSGSIGVNTTTSALSSLLPVHERLTAAGQATTQKLQLARVQREESEVKGLSFKPKLNAPRTPQNGVSAPSPYTQTPGGRHTRWGSEPAGTPQHHGAAATGGQGSGRKPSNPPNPTAAAFDRSAVLLAEASATRSRIAEKKAALEAMQQQQLQHSTKKTELDAMQHAAQPMVSPQLAVMQAAQVSPLPGRPIPMVPVPSPPTAVASVADGHAATTSAAPWPRLAGPAGSQPTSPGRHGPAGAAGQLQTAMPAVDSGTGSAPVSPSRGASSDHSRLSASGAPGTGTVVFPSGSSSSNTGHSTSSMTSAMPSGTSTAVPSAPLSPGSVLLTREVLPRNRVNVDEGQGVVYYIPTGLSIGTATSSHAGTGSSTGGVSWADAGGHGANKHAGGQGAVPLSFVPVWSAASTVSLGQQPEVPAAAGTASSQSGGGSGRAVSPSRLPTPADLRAKWARQTARVTGPDPPAGGSSGHATAAPMTVNALRSPVALASSPRLYPPASGH